VGDARDTALVRQFAAMLDAIFPCSTAVSDVGPQRRSRQELVAGHRGGERRLGTEIEPAASQRPAPPLTIVVASVQGWPHIKAAVASVEAAAARVGGEVIIGDGSGRPAPPRAEIGPKTTWFKSEGASVFQLRHEGYRRSTAPVVALTDDHCTVALDWGERILASHARHPEAAAIGGSVENGATQSLLDWASFFVVQSLFIAPIESGPSNRINGAVNVSYKRAALDGLDEFGGLGAMDVLHQRQLAEAGGSLVADDDIRCVHDQALGAVGTPLIHFHAGRTMSGFRRVYMDRWQWIRFGGTWFVPAVRFARIMAIGMGKPHRRELLASAPFIWWLLVCQAAGQFVGYIAGPGDSPRHVF
jgi:hypothetical protein